MAYGLNELEMPAGEQLPIGERDGWELLVSQEGVSFRPAPESRAFLRAASLPSAAIQSHLETLDSQEYCSEQGGSFFFSFSEMRAVRQEDKDLFYGYCESLPCSLEMHHQNNLGHPNFGLEIQFRIGGRRVYPELAGPFARLEGVFYLLSDETWHLLDEAQALNAMSADEKALLPKVLRAWASVDAAAAEAGATPDRYLRGERVAVPAKVSLDVREDEAGRVSIVPTFESVERDAMHHAYLIENEIHDVYNLDSEGGGRVRVVITEEVKSALQAVRHYRNLNPRERDRLFSRPEELLPDEVDPNVVDLSLYGPRVREIGEYPATVRPFVGTKRDWAGMEGVAGGDDLEPSSQPQEIGLDLRFEDGSAAHEAFDTPSEASQLLEEVDRALAADEPVIEFRGKRLPVGEPLRLAIAECIESFEKEEQAGRPQASDKTAEGADTSKVIGPLVYENVDDREYAEEDHDVVSGQSFNRPSALLPEIELKEHQEIGVQWLSQSVLDGKRGALLADDMGLGKTLQALTFAAWLIESDSLRTGLSSPVGPWDPILVVAPVILLEMWRDELTKFFDDGLFLPYEILDSSVLKRFRKPGHETGREGKLSRSVLDLDAIRQHRLIISNYDAVANYGFSFAQIRWSAVISDESHQFKEPSTRVSQVMKSLNTKFRLAMTGTPVVNRLMDVWNLVDFLRPLHLGSQKEFRNEYELKQEEGGSVEGARRLQKSLHVSRRPPIHRDCVVLRRSKEDELPGLPEKREFVIDCPLSEQQVVVYNDLRRISAEGSGKGKMFKLLSSLNRLLQHPALEGLLPVDSDPSELVAASPKLQSLLGELRKIRAKGEKVLVFAIYIDMQHILKRVLNAEFRLDVKIINGQTSSAGARVRRRRIETIEEFSSGRGFDVLVLSPDVAGVGLTITAANHVFHFGRWWNPAREDQATDRTHRIGQEKTVYVYRLVASDPAGRFKTFDEHLDDLISERRRTSTQFLVPAADEAEAAQNLSSRVFDGSAEEGDAKSRVVLKSAGDLEALSPAHFEAFVAAWLGTQNEKVFLTPYAGDAGVDVVALSDGEVTFAQVKHVARRGRKIDDDAVQQVRNGASHYLASVLPPALRNRTPRITVVTNGRANRSFEAKAREYGIEFIGGSALVRSLAGANLTIADVSECEAERVESMRDLKAQMAEMYG